jgi:Zn-dependent protease with chaperone function
VAGLTALCQLGLGIYVLVAWNFPEKSNCEAFSLYSSSSWRNYDLCREEIWGTIAIVCAVLWAAAFGCLVHFIRSGRHAKWEKKHSGFDDNDDEEELEAPMGCWNNNKVDDTDVPVQSGKICFCLPYDDPFMITAQILAILAIFFSWVWWPTLIINSVGLVMFQVPWFCRQTEGVLQGSLAVAGLTALCQLGLGIYVLVDFRWWPTGTFRCEPFSLWSDKFVYRDDDFISPFTSPHDYCREDVWGTIAIVCAVLWAGAFGCLLHFIRSGRHANWEKYHSSCDDTDDAEVKLEAPMGCWNNNKVEDTDIPVQSCCSVRGKRCFCLPYDDPFMITAQILAILAIFFSWVWWPTLIINIVGLVMFQVPWFCRQTEGVLHGSAAVAGLTALCQLGVGIYLLVAFRFPKKSDCIKFELKSNSSRFPNDYCSEEIWGTIAIACAVLWAAAFGCLVHFVRSGRHAKWEKYHSGCDDNDDEAELEVAIGCCSKSKEDNRGYPEGAQLCCGGRGKRFFCLPYDDPFMIASQVLAIIAAFFSWIWWVTFIISIVGLVMFQVPWFCRQTEGLLYGSAAVAGLTALCQLGLGIYVLVAWNFPEKSNCEAFSLYSSSSWINDSCQEEIWGTIAIVCAVLWAATFGCLVHFIRTGRHAKWEEKHSGCDDNNGEVEAAGVAYLDAIDSVVAAEAAPVFAEAEVVAAGGSDENTKKEAGKPSKKKKSKKLVDRDIDVTDNLDDSDHPKKKKDRKKKKKVATVHEDIAFDFKEHAASDENDLVDRPKKKKKKKKVLQE